MKAITTDQFQQIQMHLMSGVNLISQAGIILPVSVEEGLKTLAQAEAELKRALQMYCALPEMVMVFEDEDLQHTCGDCGAGLTQVRPGKWQCDVCESAQNAQISDMDVISTDVIPFDDTAADAGDELPGGQA